MKVYMVMKVRKGLTFTDEDFREMVNMSLREVQKIFPDVDIINDYKSPDFIDTDNRSVSGFHYKTNISERDINRVKLIEIDDYNRLFNKDSYVNSLLIADGENSTISSYFVKLEM